MFGAKRVVWGIKGCSGHKGMFGVKGVFGE